MEQVLIGLCLSIICAGVLIGPFIAKKIEHNFEAFLLLMSMCAVAISRSLHVGIIDETLLNPLMIGMILSILLIGAIVRYQESYSQRENDFLSDRITLGVIFFEIVAVLGLLAGIITPILSFFLLVEVVNLLPLKRRAKAGIMTLGILSIVLGAALTLMEEPFSTIANAKMQGESYLINSLLPLDLPASLIILCILVLGLIAMPFARDRMAIMEKSTSRGTILPQRITVLGARACMFVGALVFAGLAFGL